MNNFVTKLLKNDYHLATNWNSAIGCIEKLFLCENENEFNAGAFQRDFHEKKKREMPNWLISFEASTDRTVFAHMQIECDFQCQPRKERLPRRASWKQECSKTAKFLV